MAMTIIGIILIVAAVFLVVAVLMQHGKSHNLSGTIAGASETFFGKSKGSTIDRKLQVLTTIVAIVFVVLVLVAYLVQDKTHLPVYVANRPLDCVADGIMKIISTKGYENVVKYVSNR